MGAAVEDKDDDDNELTMVDVIDMERWGRPSAVMMMADDAMLDVAIDTVVSGLESVRLGIVGSDHGDKHYHLLAPSNSGGGGGLGGPPWSVT